jgi:thiamine biosynthesis lipoprotein
LVEISLSGDGREDLHEAANAAFAEIARIHDLMSAHTRDSDVFHINNAPAQSVISVDERTWRVLELATEISQASDGVFDVSVGAAMMARGTLPALASRGYDAHATYRDIELLPDCRVRLHRTLAVDLGGIAKGNAVDAAVEILKRKGVAAGCVNAGGDLRAFGEEAATVQVRDPLAPERARAQIELRDRALATSASYANDRGFNASGEVLDPRADNPVAAGRSATVRAAQCAVADALAKCVLMMGESSAPLLARFRAEGFLIDGDMQTLIDSPARPHNSGTASASTPGVAAPRDRSGNDSVALSHNGFSRAMT